jgi:hypothetical protein
MFQRLLYTVTETSTKLPVLVCYKLSLCSPIQSLLVQSETASVMLAQPMHNAAICVCEAVLGCGCGCDLAVHDKGEAA